MLRETLRQCSPIAQRSAESLADTVLEDGGKKYEIKKGQAISVLNIAAHLDPAVFGEDVSLSPLLKNLGLLSLG